MIMKWQPQPGRGYLYVQVAEHLAARIRAGDLKGRLPAEPALASEYGVAFHTIRNAMRLLRAQELVVTLHGSGNWVAGYENAPPSGEDDGAP